MECRVAADEAGGKGDSGRLGLGAALIDGDAKAQWEALANSVGPDMML
jgi:hypothetical protein